MTDNSGKEKRKRKPGAGRKPLPPEQRLDGYRVRLTQEQKAALTRMGDGNLSEGIRRLLSRYQTLISLWQRNLSLAQDALATARHFDAPLGEFEANVEEAESKLRQFEVEYNLVSSLTL